MVTSVNYAGDTLSLRQFWQVLWQGKRTVIASTIIFAVGSVAYALLAKEVFRAEVLLVPATEQSAPLLGGQLGGIAALAGVNVGDGKDVEALAVLQSRKFARDFIEQFDLLPVFFEKDWDADTNRWLQKDPADAPDVRDGVKFFHEEILSVSEARSTGLVTLAAGKGIAGSGDQRRLSAVGDGQYYSRHSSGIHRSFA